MAVSEAIENYLETIYILSQQQNEVHAIDICSYLSYSRPTVSIVLRQMRESGLVTVNEDNHIYLTEEGRRIAIPHLRTPYHPQPAAHEPWSQQGNRAATTPARLSMT